MAPTSTPDVKVVEAFAAAIVDVASLPDELVAKAGTGDQKFVVHPHVAPVPTNDTLLLGYLGQIYGSAPPLAIDYPAGELFKQLADTGTLRSATKGLAANLAVEMSRKRANAGILFGFILERSDGSKAHGLIKADLDPEQRFHMTTFADGAWSYSEVSELLPHPRTKFAKYVIAPQPNGVGKAGIRDATTEEGAAYFLAAVDLSVPKTRGTRAAVAREALNAGYTHDEIAKALESVTVPTPVADVAREHFPRIPDKQAERLVGRPERPMPHVMPDDPFIRTFKTKSPYFELAVDESVTVSINGRVVTVTLPPGDPITPGTREQRRHQPAAPLGSEHQADVVDQWGRSTTTLHGAVDIDELVAIADLPHFRVQLLVGDDDRPLTLGSMAPDADELAALGMFASNEREIAELSAARSPIEVARLLADRVEGAFVEYVRPGWTRTSAAFVEAVRSRWPEVVRDVSASGASIGGSMVKTAPVRSNAPGGLPAFRIEGTSGMPEVDDALKALADAAAWTQLAAGSKGSAGEILLALHHDQDPVIKVDVSRVTGGLDLLVWRTKDDDADRDEALRHVFRVVTASSGALPDAKTIQRLAERQRIALTRDRAAEVFRAIADGQRATAELLETSSTSFSTLIENTTNNAVATVAGVVGLVALLADKANVLPGWLVVTATVATVAGVIAVIVTRWHRVEDAKTSAERLVHRLRNDPLLPEDEEGALVAAVEGFDFAARAKSTQVTIAAVGAVACLVAIFAAGWLVHEVVVGTVPTTTTTTVPSTTPAPPAAPSSAPAPSTSALAPGPQAGGPQIPKPRGSAMRCA